MAGKQLAPQLNEKDANDPFNAGQMVGMLVMLTFIEKNKVITQDMIDQIKWSCANNVQGFLQSPSEDIFLMVNNMVKEIETL